MFKAWRVDHDVAVPTDLPGPGVYSELVSLLLSAQLEELGPDVHPERLALRDADSPDRLSRHVAGVAAAAIAALPESERATLGVELVNGLLARLHELQPGAGVLDERLLVPGEFLTAISRRLPDGLARFLDDTGLELDDVYANNHTWSELRRAVGLPRRRASSMATGLMNRCYIPKASAGWPASAPSSSARVQVGEGELGQVGGQLAAHPAGNVGAAAHHVGAQLAEHLRHCFIDDVVAGGQHGQQRAVVLGGGAALHGGVDLRQPLVDAPCERKQERRAERPAARYGHRAPPWHPRPAAPPATARAAT